MFRLTYGTGNDSYVRAALWGHRELTLFTSDVVRSASSESRAVGIRRSTYARASQMPNGHAPDWREAKL